MSTAAPVAAVVVAVNQVRVQRAVAAALVLNALKVNRSRSLPVRPSRLRLRREVQVLRSAQVLRRQATRLSKPRHGASFLVAATAELLAPPELAATAE